MDIVRYHLFAGIESTSCVKLQLPCWLDSERQYLHSAYQPACYGFRICMRSGLDAERIGLHADNYDRGYAQLHLHVGLDAKRHSLRAIVEPACHAHLQLPIRHEFEWHNLHWHNVNTGNNFAVLPFGLDSKWQPLFARNLATRRSGFELYIAICS